MNYEGKVIYRRQSNHAMWERIRQKGERYISSLKYNIDVVSQKTDTINYLNHLADSERAKETKLIQSIFGTDNELSENPDEFVRDFNELLQGKKQFEYALERLQYAISGMENNGKEYFAPDMSVFFKSHLVTELSHKLNEKIESFGVDKTLSLLDSQFEKWVESAIFAAFRATYYNFKKKANKEQYGDRSHYEALYEAYKASTQIKGLLVQVVKNLISIPRLISTIKKDADELKKKVVIKQTKKRTSITRETIEKVLSLDTQAQSFFGGSIKEFCTAVVRNSHIENAFTGSNGEIVTEGKVASTVYDSKHMRIDNVSLILLEADIIFNAQKILDDFNDIMNTSKGLLDAVDKMNDFHENNLSKLDNSFLIYESTKLYSLNYKEGNFAGFHGGGKRNLDDLGAIFNELNINGNINDIKNILYNSMNGAVMDDSKIQEDLKLKIAQAFAQILFDDWITIDKVARGAQAIHVFNLDSVYVPLSTLLYALSDAINSAEKSLSYSQNASNYVKINFQIPESIAFPDTIQLNDGETLDEYWEYQSLIVQQKSTFTITIMKNFISKIEDLIKISR